MNLDGTTPAETDARLVKSATVSTVGENSGNNLAKLMKATNPWITYRTRFLVQAKQLTTTLSFTDALGRQHSGRKGDYLVESSDGVLRIAPRQIFEDIYVPLAGGEVLVDPQMSAAHDTTWRPEGNSSRASARKTSIVPPHPASPHLVRKSPQSDRGRRSPISGLGSV